MNGHIQPWADAYLDGELTERQMQYVHVHLNQCHECRDMISERQRLRALLHSVPAVQLRLSPERFAASVKIQLPRHQQEVPLLTLYAWKRIAWFSVPLVLLLLLTFLQSVTLLSNLVALIPGAGDVLKGSTAGSLLTLNLPPLAAQAGDLINFLFNPLDWGWATGLWLSVLAGLGYLGWLAVVWVQSHKVGKQS